MLYNAKNGTLKIGGSEMDYRIAGIVLVNNMKSTIRTIEYKE